MNRLSHTIKYFLLATYLLLHATAFTQAFQRFDYLKVTDNTSELLYPWTGGLNNVLFGKADVNHDGKKDLVVYDKTGNKYCIFLTLANNSTSYKFERKYADHFPPVSGWMILKDYNCDGIEDLFTYNGVGNLKVYTGFYTNDTLNFKLQQDGFYYPISGGFYTNVYCADAIKPAVIDVNGDGDLDVISFNSSFNRLIYYENQQKELALPCDSLLFKKTDNCWGNVRDTFSSSYALRDTCIFKFGRLASPGNIQHSGSAIEGIDADNNGAIDVLIGSTTLTNLNMLYNKGAPSYSSILVQDTHYPSYNVPFNSVSFASPYFVDADNDGKQDLLVSTFDVGSANINNTWFYKNISSDSIRLQLQQKNFLVDNMVDAGENSYPCFMDVDGDGLKDIILGSGGYKDYINPSIYKLSYYRNTGTLDYPEFNLQNDDFLDVSTLNVKDLAPAAGDIDNDGDTDLVVGLSDGRLLYWENIAATGTAPDLSYRGILKDSAGNSISIGTDAAPCLIDLDRDRKTDLLIGEQRGNINYYKGTSADSAKFSYVTDSVGKIRVFNFNNNNGYTQPTVADVNGDGKYDLLLGTNLFGLQFYNDIEEHWNDTMRTLSNIVSDNIGYRTSSTIADITNDGKWELLTGSIDGGLIIFSQDPPPNKATYIKKHITEPLHFEIFPNPTDRNLFIHVDDLKNVVELQLFNLLGRQLFSGKYSAEMIELNTDQLANGLYLVKLSNGEKEGTQKIVIQH